MTLEFLYFAKRTKRMEIYCHFRVKWLLRQMSSSHPDLDTHLNPLLHEQYRPEQHSIFRKQLPPVPTQATTVSGISATVNLMKFSEIEVVAKFRGFTHGQGH